MRLQNWVCSIYYSCPASTLLSFFTALMWLVHKVWYLANNLCGACLKLYHLYYTQFSICNAARKKNNSDTTVYPYVKENYRNNLFLVALLYPRSISSSNSKEEAWVWCCSQPSIPRRLLLHHLQHVPGETSDGSLFLEWLQGEPQHLSTLQDQSQQEGFCPSLHFLLAVHVFLGVRRDHGGKDSTGE